jgi:hypothetical protein
MLQRFCGYGDAGPLRVTPEVTDTHAQHQRAMCARLPRQPPLLVDVGFFLGSPAGAP